jgi:hypothetical protein
LNRHLDSSLLMDTFRIDGMLRSSNVWGISERLIRTPLPESKRADMAIVTFRLVNNQAEYKRLIEA